MTKGFNEQSILVRACQNTHREVSSGKHGSSALCPQLIHLESTFWSHQVECERDLEFDKSVRVCGELKIGIVWRDGISQLVLANERMLFEGKQQHSNSPTSYLLPLSTQDQLLATIEMQSKH